ncbi:hypothetical protein FMUND_7413 [Fusarium mundagurra]|uniref:Uncharacterized protein n=1 Tax=Fusarium mundagurra TaxID=1567541 RepID=A0A8H5YMV1_9HYPO|nr:hypothetical protein FMUND_7413 [Fusarium mundagurra]
MVRKRNPRNPSHLNRESGASHGSSTLPESEPRRVYGWHQDPTEYLGTQTHNRSPMSTFNGIVSEFPDIRIDFTNT